MKPSLKRGVLRTMGMCYRVPLTPLPLSNNLSVRYRYLLDTFAFLDFFRKKTKQILEKKIKDLPSDKRTKVRMSVVRLILGSIPRDHRSICPGLTIYQTSQAGKQGARWGKQLVKKPILTLSTLSSLTLPERDQMEIGKKTEKQEGLENVFKLRTLKD